MRKANKPTCPSPQHPKRRLEFLTGKQAKAVPTDRQPRTGKPMGTKWIV